MGEATVDVRHRLVAEGLAPSDQTLPDHIGIELAFMAHLAEREALYWADGDKDSAEDYLAQEESFLRDHLTAWLPQFCSRVLAGRPHAHYSDLALRVEAFVIKDAVRLREWLESASGASTSSRVDPQRWALDLKDGCTLCGICVQVCRPGALQRIQRAEDGVIVLQFEATRCDGCTACQRWCPEDVISVSRAIGVSRPFSGELARSAVLPCSRCGQLHAPSAMVTKVLDQVGAANEALARRLALCASCKLEAAPLRRRDSRTPSEPESLAQNHTKGLPGNEVDALAF